MTGNQKRKPRAKIFIFARGFLFVRRKKRDALYPIATKRDGFVSYPYEYLAYSLLASLLQTFRFLILKFGGKREVGRAGSRIDAPEHFFYLWKKRKLNENFNSDFEF